jgi:hypothetical protein
LQNADYSFITFEKWCEGNVNGKFVVLRHDVDLKAERSLKVALIEAEIGISASYYFRAVPQSNQPNIIKAIAALGHEIGYHYEDLSLFDGDYEKALAHFTTQLAHFRQFYPVKTICMHGSPTSKFDNRDIWTNSNYRDFDLIGEPYLDFLSSNAVLKGEIAYFTDTARMWNGDRFNVRDKSMASVETDVIDSQKNIHTTFDFINYVESNPPHSGMMITTHPQRWTDCFAAWCGEFVLQSIKNQIKMLFFT